jgi:hypothetical protein
VREKSHVVLTNLTNLGANPSDNARYAVVMKEWHVKPPHYDAKPLINMGGDGVKLHDSKGKWMIPSAL